MSKKKVTPCNGCGEPKPVGRGRKLCDACRDSRLPVLQQEWARRKAAKLKAVRQIRRENEGRGPHWRDVPAGQKWCNRCKELMPLSRFSTTLKHGERVPTAYCKVCHSQYHHERGILTRMGVTLDDYEAVAALQGERCAICQVTPKTRRLAIDHDHKTGLVRGLLCTRCNHKLLGSAKESVEILQRAIDYLTTPPAAHLSIQVKTKAVS